MDQTDGSFRTSLGVEVVVDGDAAHAHGVCDVLDRFAESESTTLIEDPHRRLFADPVQIPERGAEFVLDQARELRVQLVAALGAEAAELEIYHGATLHLSDAFEISRRCLGRSRVQ